MFKAASGYLVIFIFYINYDRPFEDKGYIFIPVVLLVVLYVFNGPIDHWWRTKYPVKFDEKLDEWLVRFFRPYNQMPEEIAVSILAEILMVKNGGTLEHRKLEDSIVDNLIQKHLK